MALKQMILLVNRDPKYCCDQNKSNNIFHFYLDFQ
jgi:hypothetical protein